MFGKSSKSPSLSKLENNAPPYSQLSSTKAIKLGSEVQIQVPLTCLHFVSGSKIETDSICLAQSRMLLNLRPYTWR